MSTLPARDLFPHAIDENLATAARQAPQARVLEASQHLNYRQFELLVEKVDLWRTETMNVDRGKVRADVAQQFLVPLHRQIRMQTTLHQDLVAAEFHGLAHLLQQDVAIQNVSLGVADLSIKGAEIADRGADVRIIDVAVDVVGAIRLGMQSLANGVRGAAEREEVAARIRATPSSG